MVIGERARGNQNHLEQGASDGRHQRKYQVLPITARQQPEVAVDEQYKQGFSQRIKETRAYQVNKRQPCQSQKAAEKWPEASMVQQWIEQGM